MKTYHSYHVESLRQPSRVRAVCSCGWKSDWLTNGGLAGASWDLHKATVETVPRTSSAMN